MKKCIYLGKNKKLTYHIDTKHPVVGQRTVHCVFLFFLFLVTFFFLISLISFFIIFFRFSSLFSFFLFSLYNFFFLFCLC
jgi:hypothetical protein